MPYKSSGDGVFVFVGGVAIGVGFSAWLASERKRSRAEKERPRHTHQVAEEVDELLNELVLDGDIQTEAEFHDALVSYFEDESEFEVESKPRTASGEPDIVLDDVVAIEIKVNPRKSECDRCVGQVGAFAQEWLTLIVLFDTPPTRVRALLRSLENAELSHVPVIDFSTE